MMVDSRFSGMISDVTDPFWTAAAVTQAYRSHRGIAADQSPGRALSEEGYVRYSGTVDTE